MAGRRIDAVMLEAEHCEDGRLGLVLRAFDGSRCAWDVVDQCLAAGDELGVGLLEMMGAFEQLTEALARSRGVQLTLPFP